jgi:hypothetical protein
MSGEARKGNQGECRMQNAECRSHNFRKVPCSVFAVVRSVLWLRQASLVRFAHCLLFCVLCLPVLIVIFPSSCRKAPPPKKVVNPMIDSAEKFVQVYTETLPPPQSGLDVFLDIMRPKPDTTDTSFQPSSAGDKESAIRAQAKPPSREPQAGRGSGREATDGREVVLIKPDTSEPVYNAGTVEVLATVRRVEIEGIFWGLKAENGQNYDPLNMPDELKQAGLKVRFFLRMRKDISSTHMWGTPVQIVRYSIPPAPKKR